MRVAFMGTPQAAVPTLEALIASHDVVVVYTQPDKARGRGRTVSASPVKRVAETAGIDVRQPTSLRRGEAAWLTDTAPDVCVVVAYGKILPADVLSAPRLGCVNVHFSLLPRWRGAAPVAHAVLAGDAETGVTTMAMDEGLDTGPILLTASTPIGPRDTTGALTERLAELGASLIGPTLAGLQDGTLAPRGQPTEGVTVAPRIEVDDARVDLDRSAVEIERLVRAMDPAPGAWTTLRGKRLKIWRADAVDGDAERGVVVEIARDGPVVQTGRGRLVLTEVQLEGKRRMGGADMARGLRLEVGEPLGVAAPR